MFTTLTSLLYKVLVIVKFRYFCFLIFRYKTYEKSLYYNFKLFDHAGNLFNILFMVKKTIVKMMCY